MAKHLAFPFFVPKTIKTFQNFLSSLATKTRWWFWGGIPSENENGIQIFGIPLLPLGCTWCASNLGGAVPFWRRRVCKGQKTPFFSIAGTHRPHIFFTVAWAHTQRPIFLHLICHSKPHDLKSWHVKKFKDPTFLWYFCSHLMTPHIFVFFSHWMPKIMLSPNDPSFFEPVLSLNAPACLSAALTPVSISYLTAPPPPGI